MSHHKALNGEPRISRGDRLNETSLRIFFAKKGVVINRQQSPQGPKTQETLLAQPFEVMARHP
jgi:hypothetical protein